MCKKIFAFILLVSSFQSRANVFWLWNFDTEYGYVVTSGSFSDTLGAASFNILSFHVIDSQFPANIGANYLENQPVQGFLWDGNEAVEFFRSNGTFTNGSNFNLEGTGFAYTLIPPPDFALFQASVRTSRGLPVFGLLTIKTDIIFRNRFE